ncbi:MAG TPA: DUF5931 domain-containing protein [Actinomycetes bacterium]|nr:DUF5931 domain-containing protein [Actinomycetes bacterium]
MSRGPADGLAASETDPTGALWRALAVYRIATVLYVVVAYAVLAQYYRHPAAGWLVVAGIAAWTGVAILLYRRPAGRSRPVLSLDLVLALLAVLVNPLIDQPLRIDAGEPTMALIWPSGALLAWSIQWGWRGGLSAAGLLSAAALMARGELTRSTGNNIVLMILAGAVTGYAVDLFRRSEEALQQAARMEAATRERERLSRSIHDGVLQVLALVQRRAPELGVEGVELGKLADEQQQALRGLLVGQPGAPTGGRTDFAALINDLASSTVAVATPAGPVWLASGDAAELDAAVSACLDNVRVHVGPDSPAWVLLEEDASQVVVTVRDEGPGIPDGRLEESAAEGRLGVAQSIRGRVTDLGGTVTITSAPGQGTEVEIRVPRVLAT